MNDIYRPSYTYAERRKRDRKIKRAMWWSENKEDVKTYLLITLIAILVGSVIFWQLSR